MKRTFFAKMVFVAAAAVSGSLAAEAQTQSSPLELHPGANGYDAGDSYVTVYYTYTPATDCLVTLDGARADVTANGEAVPYYSTYTPDSTVFQTKGGTTYLLSIFSMNGDVSFIADMVDCVYADGSSCDNPVQATQGDVFVPFRKASGWGQPAPTIYIAYTAQSTGRLNMTFPMAVSNMQWATDCSGDYKSLTWSGATASLDVEEDVTYYFKGGQSSAVIATFAEEAVTPGGSCADAWALKRGVNVIPAEAGTYWYSYTAPAAPTRMFAVITSEANLNGGTSTIKTSCSSTYGDVALNGEIRFRQSIPANDERYLCIEKKVATDADEALNFAWSDYQTYDSFETAEPLEAGEPMSTPDFGGTYYYGITSPEKGDLFLDLTSDGTLADGVSVTLYAADKDYLALAHGTGLIHYNVAPATDYVLVWELPAASRSVTFNVAFNEVQPGETAASPIEAHLGENELPACLARYYAFTALSTKWLEIRPAAAGIRPSVKLPDGGAATLFETDGGAAYKFETEAGETYAISFANVATATTFTLSELDYAPGDDVSHPIVVDGGNVVLPDSEGRVWYRYTAPKGGILTISTTMAYSAGASVQVYCGEITESNRQQMGTQGSWLSPEFAPMNVEVSAADVVTVCVTKNSGQTDATLSFELRDVLPGEKPSSAIVIDFTGEPLDYDFDRTADYSQPVWYRIHLTAGMFSLVTTSPMSMNLYDVADATQSVATSGSWADENYAYSYGFSSQLIETEGDYYLCLINSTAAFTATLSMRDAGPGEAPFTAIEIAVVSDPMTFEIAELPYNGIPRWYSIKLKEGVFNFDMPRSCNFYLYTADDTDKAIATTSYNYSDGHYVMNDVAIATPGIYYLKTTTVYADATATLSGSALDTSAAVKAVEASGALHVSVSVNAGEIAISGAAGCRVVVADMLGRVVAEGSCENGMRISVNPGIYVVNAGSTTAKVRVP